MEKAIKASNLKNLDFRDLNEIKAYRKERLFRKKKRLPHDLSEPIWQKVDLARLLVVNHILTTTNAETVFYSDFDIINPQISSDHLKQILDKYGMVFAKSNRNKDPEKQNPFELENQFMGFRQRARDFVANELIPTTKKEITEKGYNGWPPLCLCIRKRFSAVDPTLESITIHTQEINQAPSTSSNYIHFQPTPRLPDKFLKDCLGKLLPLKTKTFSRR